MSAYGDDSGDNDSDLEDGEIKDDPVKTGTFCNLSHSSCTCILGTVELKSTEVKFYISYKNQICVKCFPKSKL